MSDPDAEDRALRSVALLNASAILRERERVERELAAEREKLRITLLSIGDAVVSTTADGRVDLLNAVAELLTGWSQSEAAGRPITEVMRLVDERTRQPVENPALQAIAERRPLELASNTLLISRDGLERPIDDAATPMIDATGAVLGAVLVFRDVSERRRASDAEQRLAAIVHTSQDAIVGKTLDGIIRSWNQGAEQIFGWKAAEIIGKPVTTLIPPERHDEERQILSRLAKGLRIEHFETVRVTKDGRRLDVSLTISPIRNAEGVIIGASKIARDVTPQRRAVAEVELGAIRLQLALEAARLGDWSWDIASDVLTMSARAAALFGISPGPNLTWTHLQQLIHPDDRERTNLAVQQAVATRADYEMEYRVRPAGSQDRWILAKGRAQYSPIDGSPQSMFGVVQDITDRKRLEHELITKAEQLAELDRQKDDFIALLAHELRNPLAPIRNGLHVMRLAGDDVQKITAAREVMNRQLLHMVRLIDDLLDISRMKRSKLHLQKQRVLLSEVVANAVEVVRPAIDAAGHQLTVSLPQLPIELDADLTRIAQVLSNLLANSAKYTEPGGHITLTAAMQGPSVVITVKDDGIGIPQEALPTVFEMFAQVNRRIEQVTGGLGIGLALVKGLVEAHGGGVSAHSAGPGKGSTFTVRLPVLPPQAPRLEAEPQLRERAPARRLKVLVADDNHDGASSMAELLEMLGHEAKLAHDGEEAVALAGQFHPDLILMDVGMPRLNGLEAARRIRGEAWGQTVAIYALTGWGKETDRQRSREAGCDGHLVKPVGITALEELISEIAAVPTGVGGAADAPESVTRS